MKKFLCIILSLTLIVLTFCSCSKAPEYASVEKSGRLSVVSFNCAAPWGSYSDGTSSGARVKRFAAYMNAVQPDLIGTQEMNSSWSGKLEKLMPEYDSYGVQRGGDDSEKKSEMNSIFWRRDKFDLVSSDTFWLSETVTSESKYPGAGCNRICSCVVLTDKETNDIIIHMNTHLDNESEAAREYGAKLIMFRLNTILSGYTDATVILTGDLNSTADDEPYSIITEKLVSCDTVAFEPPALTYQDWGNIDDGAPIDFVFTNKTPVNFMLLDDTSNGYVSDHYGIYAEII